MSCLNANAPIDINMSTITGKCDLKCSYTFSYTNSSCTSTNRGDYISVSYDKSSSPPVLYNSVGYDVQEIRVYTPSLHSYNGSKKDAEIIIIHSSKMGSNPLLVCIPIESNNSSSVSSMFFKTLIDTVASSAPSEGETTTVNVNKFNLSSFVPRKPFFSYSAREPYQPCSTEVEYIVYQDSLDILSDTLTKLQTIISKNQYDIKKGPNLFYNEKGPRSGTASDDIYIDCQPVGSSEETTEVFMGNSTSWDDLQKNWIVRMILAAFVFILILFGLKYLLNLSNTKLPIQLAKIS
jgi:carbonic anhydrase